MFWDRDTCLHKERLKPGEFGGWSSIMLIVCSLTTRREVSLSELTYKRPGTVRQPLCLSLPPSRSVSWRPQVRVAWWGLEAFASMFKTKAIFVCLFPMRAESPACSFFRHTAFFWYVFLTLFSNILDQQDHLRNRDFCDQASWGNGLSTWFMWPIPWSLIIESCQERRPIVCCYKCCPTLLLALNERKRKKLGNSHSLPKDPFWNQGRLSQYCEL